MAARPGRKRIEGGWPSRAALSRRSRSCYKRVSKRCVWANSGAIVLTAICAHQVPTWSLFPLVRNLGALRGLDTIASAGIAAAIGDPSRFPSAPDFMAYLGLVPSEHSSGPKRHIGGITKCGDIHARTLLIEAAHSYRFPARIARRKLAAIDAVPEAVRAIAWKAQT